MSAGRWLLRWVGLAVVLVVLATQVRSLEVGLPWTDSVVALDFAGAYTRPTWRLALFLVLALVVVVRSWRNRKEVAR